MNSRSILVTLGALTLAGLGGLVFAGARADRPDCPGKVVCSLTGELVCRDRCPLIDPAREDCPGRIECPLTGELVCRDRCPQGASRSQESETGAPCCRE